MILLALSAAIKGILHVYLDLKNGYTVEFASSKGYIYFMQYDRDVSEEYEGKRKICNIAQRTFLILIGCFVIVSFTRFILK